MLANSWCVDPKSKAAFEYLQSDLNLIAKTKLKDECHEKSFLQLDSFQKRTFVIACYSGCKDSGGEYYNLSSKKVFQVHF